MLLVDIGSVLTVGIIAILLLGWLYTFVKLKLIQYRIIDLPSDNKDELKSEPNKYKEAFDQGVVVAMGTVPIALAFFIKCTAYALTAVAIIFISLFAIASFSN